MFVLGKLLAVLTQPLCWVGLWWSWGLWRLARRQRGAFAILALGPLWLVVLGFVALPDLLLRPLEERFPVPPEAEIGRVAGVIVLGGALEGPEIFVTHGQVPLGDAAERMTVPLAWLRRWPELVLVFSGGEGRLLRRGPSEAEMARAFYLEQGVAPQRLLFEGKSRNTRENALQVAQLLGARCQQAPWLLVTSAAHMWRAQREFVAVGCQTLPYPVDFMTGDKTPWHAYSLTLSLQHWVAAMHEWLGLAYYVFRL